MVPSWLLLGAALAAEPATFVEQVLPAEPDEVYAALADLRHWAVIWGFDADSVPFHVRGPGGPDKPVLRWSGGERARGVMQLVERVPGRSVNYEVRWSTRPSLRRGLQPLGHGGRITLSPTEHGTKLTWAIDRTARRGDKMLRLERRLRDTVKAGLERVVGLVDHPRTARPPSAPRDAALVWQGMHHSWTYNHRINRSGDWWRAPSCKAGDCTAEWVHAAASGSGEDVAHFDSGAVLLAAPGLEAWYGTLQFWLDGREGEVLEEHACLPLPKELGEGPALLRGYDMDAVESADSLQQVAVSVERRDQQVCGTVRIQMACKTPECGTEKLTTYAIDLPVLVLHAPDLHVDRTSVQQEISWEADDLRDLPEPRNHRLQAEFFAHEERPAAVGLTGFSVALERAEHTLALDVALDQQPVEDGRLPVDIDLFYQQWGPVEMAPLTVAQFAHAGSAELSADLVLLQPRGGCASSVRETASLFWPGKGADASVPLAEHVSAVSFEGCEP